MMRLRLEVAPDGADPFQAVAGPRDILHWEKTHKGRTASQLADGVSMSAVYEIGYVTVTRRGLWSGTFEAFCDQVDVSPTDDDEDSVDPTSEGPSDEPLSSLPSLPASPPPSGRKKASGQ